MRDEVQLAASAHLEEQYGIFIDEGAVIKTNRDMSDHGRVASVHQDCADKMHEIMASGIPAIQRNRIAKIVRL